MKVLVATTETQGEHDGDYCGTVDGELVYVQGFDCASPNCGCDRGFAGMASGRATSTAKVVDRQALTRDDVAAALRDSLARGGWLEHVDVTEGDRMVAELLGTLDHITEAPTDSVVRRLGDLAYVL